MMLPQWSLDTPLPPGTVAAGHNFREVAPEILSPLSWSLVGAGMERGFRWLGEQFGSPTTTPVPRYVAYVGFRPFHVMSELDLILSRAPGVDAGDCWELLLGGLPAGLRSARRDRGISWLSGVRCEVAVLRASDRRFRDCARAVAEAEHLVGRVVDGGNPWSVGGAAVAAAAGAVDGWALHAVTTSLLIAAAGIFGRSLAVEYGEELAADLLRNLLRRQPVPSSGALPVPRLPADSLRVLNYEVADGGELFGTEPAPVTAAPTLATPAPAEILPRGRVGDRLIRRLLGLVQTLVSEREASKLLALRGLHCVRLLIELDAADMQIDELAMLSISELLRAPQRARRERAQERIAELHEARHFVLPVDFEVRPSGIKAIDRKRPSLVSVAEGRALAPGWARGPLTRDLADAAGSVLVSPQVEAHDALRSGAAAIVTEYGSLLSHVAIICRELGIPLVTGIRADEVPAGTSVTVDGSTGRVTVDDQERRTA